ncbi:MAG: ChaN family lipoprotein [Elainellaceae cyanobacterium]
MPVSEPTAENSFHDSQSEILRSLAQANIVYLGETHDSPADHQAQLQIIQALHQENPQLAIGLEMFQRPFQPFLDQYLQGEISEAQLRKQTEYDDRWGFDWEYYAPILRFAKDNQIPLVALNTPAEVTRTVAQQGLAGLSEADQQYIPPLSEIHTDDDAYRQMIQEVFAGHHGHSTGSNFDNFFLAQVLWDETMADRIAAFLTENPDQQIVVLAGQGHVVYGYGIPSRVERRLGSEVTQQSVLFSNSTSEFAGEAGTIADHIWLTQ